MMTNPSTKEDELLAKYRYKGRHRIGDSHPVRVATASLATAMVALLSAQSVAYAAPGDNTWDQLAQCESSGNWSINTGNGFSGGLQFTPSTWRAYGGTGNAHNASRSEQIAVAERVLQGQGWGAWPACSAKLGLRGTPKSVKTAPKHAAPKVQKNNKVKVTKVAPVKVAPPRVGKHRTLVSTGSYVVVQGDTLSKIARGHKIKGGWRAIYKKNAGLGNPDLIFPGEKITL